METNSPRSLYKEGTLTREEQHAASKQTGRSGRRGFPLTELMRQTEQSLKKHVYIFSKVKWTNCQ